MAREGWTSLMLKKETLAALQRYRDECWALREQGKEVLRPNESPGEGKPSMDATINRLLELVNAHRDAAARQRARRKRRGGEERQARARRKDNPPPELRPAEEVMAENGLRVAKGRVQFTEDVMKRCQDYS